MHWRLSLYDSGYCEKTKTYNDDATIIRLAVANELKYMDAFGAALDGKDLNQVKAEGKGFRRIDSPAYTSVDDFFAHNTLPDCCLLDPDDERGPVDLSLLDRLTGYNHGLFLVWASPYLEEDGTKVFLYRGDQPSELLKYVYPQTGSSIGNSRYSVLKVTNCGDTEPAWMQIGDYGGRH